MNFEDGLHPKNASKGLSKLQKSQQTPPIHQDVFSCFFLAHKVRKFKTCIEWFHQQLNGTLPTDPLSKLLELLDTQV